MELQIYDVAYYTKEYGKIKEISDMCQDLSDFVKTKSYSKIIDCIRVGPAAVPQEVLEKGLWKESNKVWISTGDANVTLHIDYDTYVNATIEEKKEIVINNILASVKIISKKGKIDYAKFSKDIIDFCENNKIEVHV